MNNRYFYVVIFCISWICLLSHGKTKKYYQRFTHIKTGRIVQTNGHASYNYNPDLQVFNAKNYFEDKYVILDWYLEESNPSAMGIVGGCAQNKTVKTLRESHGPNQDWYIDNDKGTIASACNKNWLLTVNHYGDQYVQDKRIIPEGEEKFNIEWKVSTSIVFRK